MRKSRKKVAAIAEQLQKKEEMSSWSKQIFLMSSPHIQQIPTYRRQIVQKFLSTIPTKHAKVINQNKQKSMSKISKQKQQMIFLGGRTVQARSRRQSKTEAEQQFHVLNIFKQYHQKKDKLKVRPTIVNLDLSVQKSKSNNSKNNYQTIIGNNNKSFARKLRLKQQIANKKNIQRVIRKNRSLTFSNIFKNPFYLLEFGNIQTAQKKRSSNETKRRNSQFKSRPSSESAIRCRNNTITIDY